LSVFVVLDVMAVAIVAATVVVIVVVSLVVFCSYLADCNITTSTFVIKNCSCLDTPHIVHFLSSSEFPDNLACILF
jgi:hypothetical protein